MSWFPLATLVAGAPGDETKARQEQERVGQKNGSQRGRSATANTVRSVDRIVHADTLHRDGQPHAARCGIRCHTAYSDTRRHDHQRHHSARTDRSACRRCRRGQRQRGDSGTGRRRAGCRSVACACCVRCAGRARPGEYAGRARGSGHRCDAAERRAGGSRGCRRYAGNDAGRRERKCESGDIRYAGHACRSERAGGYGNARRCRTRVIAVGIDGTSSGWHVTERCRRDVACQRRRGAVLGRRRGHAAVDSCDAAALAAGRGA